MKILVTGGTGLVGSRFIELNSDLNLLFPSSKEFDITNVSKITTYLTQNKPDLIVHFAAYTDTEEAEVKRELAWELNVKGTSNIATLCKDLQIKLIFISTDHTFNGEKGAYREDDEQNPVNFYGMTKLEAEKTVRNTLKDFLIVRTSYPFRADFPRKGDCVRWMIPRLKNNQEASLVIDQYITPTFIDDFVLATRDLVTKEASGIYHVAGSECLSFWNMGRIVCENFGFDTKLLKKISLREFLRITERKAKAPMNSCLDCSKLKKDFGLVLPDFKTSLSRMKKQMEDVL